MLKDDFKVLTDRNSGERYVMKVRDEETKNHKEMDQDIISGFMPEMKGDKYCPVDSYIRYINALSPKSDKLWQTAKFKTFPQDGSTIWYYGKMGHNKDDSFVADICEKLKMEKRYTNHCLRVTAITNLMRQNYNNKQIMSITGHKSSTSLEIYQKVNAEEKLEMGKTLALSMRKDNIPQEPRQCRCKATSTLSNIENTENAEPKAKMPLVEIPMEEDPNFNFSADDLLTIMEQCEKASEDYTLSNMNT